jgi:hypothetical protein
MATGEEICFDPRLQGPFTMVISGPTSCGKSQLVFKLIRRVDELMTPEVHSITYCYGQWQAGFNEFKDRVTFHQGLISEDALLKNDGSSDIPQSLVIIDDLIDKQDIATVKKVFTAGSHHQKTNVIFISQALFMKDPNYRIISLNTHYLIVFKNPRDMSQINVLSRQIYPNKPKFISTVYNTETTAQHSYIALDFKQTTPAKLRVRDSITTPWHTHFFIPKNK